MAQNNFKNTIWLEVLIIIGILALFGGLVFFSFEGKRERQRDQAISNKMKELRSAAEVYYVDKGNYTGFEATEVAQKISQDVVAQKGEYAFYLNKDGSGYCVSSSLPTGGFWCTDSNLISQKDADGVLVKCQKLCSDNNACLCD